MKPLTAGEFRASGYVVLNKFETVNEIQDLRDEVTIAARKAQFSWTPDADSHPFFDVWVAGVDKVSDLAFKLSRSERVVGLAEELLGAPVVPLRSCYAASQPRSQTPSPWHADASRYAAHFGSLPALAICLPLSDVGPRAGGLQFLRGVRSTETTDEVSTPSHLDPAILGAAARTVARTITARPGDAIAYHSYAPYRVDANDTEQVAEFVVIAYRFSPYRHRFGSALSRED